MSAIFLLMGLLALSYIGSFLVGGRAVRGIGLPSGAEYVALGFVLGPQIFGTVERSTLAAFEPFAHVALGWLAFVIGLHFGVAGDRRARASSVVLGVVSSAVTGGAVFAAVLVVLRRYPAIAPGVPPWLFATSLAITCAETTRHAVRWVVERYRASGPLASLLNDVSQADDLLPMMALTAVFALVPNPAQSSMTLPLWGWLIATPALGIVLGVVAVALIGREFSLNATWGVLLGVSLLAIGVAARFDLSPVATTFFAGLTIAIASPHRSLLREATAPTERPVLLPMLLLAGARLEIDALRTHRALLVLIGVALGARIAGKLVTGVLLRASSKAARRADAGLGIGLLSSGEISMCFGLALAIRFPGAVGDTVLATAVAAAILGELVGPSQIRRALAAAGEIVEAPPAPPDPATEKTEEVPS